LEMELPVYGSFSASNYNVRPDIDLTTADGRSAALDFLRHYGRIVKDCNGSLTGGTPEGKVKAIAMPSLPPEERNLYLEIKQTFDPNNILNPGVKLGADLYDVIRHVRTSPAKYISE